MMLEQEFIDILLIVSLAMLLRLAIAILGWLPPGRRQKSDEQPRCMRGQPVLRHAAQASQG